MEKVFFSLEEIQDKQQRGLIGTSNFHQYSPYYFDEDTKIYTIDISWWATQPNFIKQSILAAIDKKIEDIKFAPISCPHSFKRKIATIKIYDAYTFGFDYDNWYSPMIANGPSNVIIVTLTDMEKQILSDAAEIRIRKNKPYEENNGLKSIRERIEKVTDINKEYFVRLSGTSAKKDFIQLTPLKKSRNIMNHLTGSFSFLSQEYCKKKKTSIIIIPWNNLIKPRQEFRVFICEKKITAISAQRWGRDHTYTIEEANIIEESICKSNFWHDIPYDSFVADVWVNFEEEKAYLIECNPFGIFSASGSALFSWEKNYNILYGKTKPQLWLRKSF